MCCSPYKPEYDEFEEFDREEDDYEEDDMEEKRFLDVLNVGQGDSIIIYPSRDCIFSDDKLIVDLGPGQYDITKHFEPEDNIHIIITHHDADHLNGIRFFVDKMHLVEDITVPLYQNEITIIANSILKLKGFDQAKNCEDLRRELEDIVSNQLFLKSITESIGRLKLKFAYEGKSFCQHFEFLNPPIEMVPRCWISSDNAYEAAELIDDCFTPEYAWQLKSYLSIGNYFEDRKDYWQELNYYDEDAPEISSLLVEDKETTHLEIGPNLINRRAYLISFLLSNASALIQFTESPSRETLYPVFRSFIKCTHDACIVLLAKHDNLKFLLTGDASKKVFRRMIQKNKCCNIEYLKMPHHGSKRNMDEKILKQINPDTVIICHDNRRFGTSEDSLPNKEIMEMLQNAKRNLGHSVNILVTNDVKKADNNKVIKVIQAKALNKDDPYVKML